MKNYAQMLRLLNELIVLLARVRAVTEELIELCADTLTPCGEPQETEEQL